MLGDELLKSLDKLLDEVERNIVSFSNSQSPEVADLILLNQDNVSQMIKLMKEIQSSIVLSIEESELLEGLFQSFEGVYQAVNSFFYTVQAHSDCTNHICFTIDKVVSGSPGRPKFDIPKGVLEELRGLGFTWTKIGKIFQVSRHTILRRVDEYNLHDLSNFSDISENELDEIIREYISRHGPTTGEPMMSGYLRSKGYRI